MISNFEGMLKTGNLSNMFHFENWLGNKVTGKKRFGKRKFYKKLNQAWINCYNEYLRVFGLNKHHLRMMDIEDKIALLKIRFHITGKKQLKALITIKERELEAMKTPDAEKRSFEEDLVIIQKHQGVPVYGETTSATRFFTYAKLMSEEAEKLRSKQVSKKLNNG